MGRSRYDDGATTPAVSTMTVSSYRRARPGVGGTVFEIGDEQGMPHLAGSGDLGTFGMDDRKYERSGLALTGVGEIEANEARRERLIGTATECGRSFAMKLLIAY